VDTLILGTSPEEGVLMGRPSKYSREFREQAVELVKASGKTVAEVARDLQINDTTLGNWVKADRAERGVPDETGLLPLTAAERAELTRLRRENNTLKTEREILKKSGGLLRVNASMSSVRRGSLVSSLPRLRLVACPAMCGPAGFWPGGRGLIGACSPLD